jgi:hypothetical protein
MNNSYLYTGLDHFIYIKLSTNTAKNPKKQALGHITVFIEYQKY